MSNEMTDDCKAVLEIFGTRELAEMATTPTVRQQAENFDAMRLGVMVRERLPELKGAVSADTYNVLSGVAAILLVRGSVETLDAHRGKGG